MSEHFRLKLDEWEIYTFRLRDKNNKRVISINSEDRKVSIQLDLTEKEIEKIKSYLKKLLENWNIYK